MSGDLISIIIPSYNRKSVISTSINSVLKQTHSNWEVLVIDDGSTDGTKDFVASNFSDPRIKLYSLENNQGVHAARNHGIDLAQGDYIAFLDSDDELLPQSMKIALGYFSDPSIGMVGGPYQTSRGDLTSFNINQPTLIPFSDLLCQRNVRANKAGFNFMRRSIVGNYRFLAPNVDFIFYRYVARHTKLMYHGEPLGIYNLGSDLALSKNRKKPNINLSIKRAQAIKQFLEDFGKDIIKNCPSRYSNYAYGASLGLLLDKQTKKGRLLAWRAWQFNKARLKYLIYFIFAYLPFSPQLLRAAYKWRMASPHEKSNSLS